MGRSEIEKIAQDHCGHLTERQFIDMYDAINAKPHNFLMINYKKPDHERFTEGFSKKVGMNPLTQVDETKIADHSGSSSSSESD